MPSEPEQHHGRSRRVHKLEIRTPLVVPSFSSRGFPDVGAIHASIKDRLFGVCLISAWDIANGHIEPDTLSDTDVVILDSGGYEAIDGASNNVPSGGWSEQKHRAVLANLDDKANVITVSYDRHGTLEAQKGL